MYRTLVVVSVIMLAACSSTATTAGTTTVVAVTSGPVPTAPATTTTTVAATTTTTPPTTGETGTKPERVRARVSGLDIYTDAQIDTYAEWLCTTLTGKNPSDQDLTGIGESIWDVQAGKANLSDTPVPQIDRGKAGQYTIAAWDVYCKG